MSKRVREVDSRTKRVVALGLITALALHPATWAWAQPGPAGTPAAPVLPGVRNPGSTPGSPAGTGMQAADRLAEEALAAPTAAPVEPPLPPKVEPRINLWQLANQGGVLMYPIYLCSVAVVCFGFERAFGLRRRKLMPPKLLQELGELAKRQGGVDPKAAYRACMKYPSTASTVIRAVLLKIGRPFAEMEQTLREVNEREAAKLYKNVRPIELQISIAPLLGLLGTVQGMIMAFFDTAFADLHANKAEQLAKGIYVALVTTFAGLCVAIPAAVLAHHFEGRIQNLFRDLDEFVLGMLPQWERYEGKLRVNRQTLSGEPEPAATTEHSPAPSERAPIKVPK